MIVIVTIIALVVGLGIGILVCKEMYAPKLLQTQMLDKEIELTNQKNKAINEQLTHESAQLNADIQQLHQSFENDKELLHRRYLDYENTYRNEYYQVLDESAESFVKIFENRNNELQELNSQITDLKAKVKAAVEANIRAQEIKEQENFYRLCLSKDDINEIHKLREVEPYLRDPTPLNKVIWKVYYERPYTDLVGRVVGNTPRMGIYKITNLENGMCYVGRSVDFAKRWKQHILCGIGADKASNNKLYPAMLTFGVENFTFEIIEECEKEKLGEREQYWQEYFQARSFGYSIK